MNKSLMAAGLCLAAWILAGPAWAHHMLGGQTPMGFSDGFMSGLAHPIINFEHFAFVIAIGILAAVAQGSFLLPAWFVGGTIVGCLAIFEGLRLPMGEWLVPISVLVIGLALTLQWRRMSWAGVGLFALGGFFHGAAYADSILGSGSGSVVYGYLLGFAIVQTVVATAALGAAYMLWCGDRLYANARVVGGMVAGVGLTVLFQTGTALIFPQI